jgi:predicted ATPase/DNA-binding CsgD family transcriptional regulator
MTQARAPMTRRLPAQVSSFVGRARDLDDVGRLVRESRLVTLTGPAGGGKTRLAIAVAASLEDAGLAVDFLDLAPITDVDLVVGSMAAALGIRQTSGESLFEAVVQRTIDRERVFLLDNLEQIPAIGGVVAELLARSPGLRVLATSRVPLHVRGEHEYPVEPLPEDDAVSLFVERANAIRPDSAVTDLSGEAIAAICARLDGLPLAIELAAARTRVFSPDALLARLDRRLAIVVDGPADAPVRQRTLRSAIGWSYDLLSEPERRRFAATAVFAGSFSLEAAKAVASGDPDANAMSDLEAGIHQLVEHNLVRIAAGVDDEPRFRLLETIREFGLEQSSRSDLAALRDRHLAYYVGLAEHSESQLRGPDQAAWIRRLASDQADIRAALAWAQEAGRDESLIRLASALKRRFWYEAGGLAEGLRWLEAAIAVDNDAALPYRAKALQRAAWIVWEIGDGVRSESLFEASLAAARNDDHATRFEAFIGLSYRALHAGGAGLEVAATRMGEAIEHARRSGAPAALVEPLTAQGHLARARGDNEHASGYFREALAAADDAGDSWGAATASLLLGDLALTSGDPSGAEQLLEASTRLASESGDREVLFHATIVLAEALTTQGNQAAARMQLRKAIDALGDMVNPLLTVYLLGAAGDWLANVAEPYSAVETWAAAERYRSGQRWPELPDKVRDRGGSVTAARAQLGPVRFERAWTSGQARSLELAVESADEAINAVDLQRRPSPQPGRRPFDLTAREREVLALVSAGMTDGEIAESLVISKKTASVHVANVKAKLGASSRVEMATMALRQGLG